MSSKCKLAIKLIFFFLVFMILQLTFNFHFNFTQKRVYFFFFISYSVQNLNKIYCTLVAKLRILFRNFILLNHTNKNKFINKTHKNKQSICMFVFINF